ncbi:MULTISPECIES: thiamine phosphate synthase [Pedobacter]|uniref:Thiamine-phosphate synthase n=1 Tax=Pedobacter heparinus (strain ATCC 13125 / DSM 2366 / CIP 104194 / JCM 7457 / NBRC 12017 / NCIMB 9290 / NRRL B-14731 / HIM 762-3) TaxID=485917 RepID=C6XZH7_PEDHD|nr:MULTISPECIES: thiamine phosphate synthase [Pedobacter]ACU04673.1 thiamine-phosphate pyrophosphorylase [Pedobacter heparinus DSM 2366]MBB5437476.1 thiamine-phosphate pyrophosphorylase [Pedobacter sp. AK017]
MRIDQLHYISQASREGHLEAIERVLLAGGKWIQLRVKNEPEAVVLSLAIAAAALCKKHAARLIVNDYPEIALKAGADGVHLGLDDMPVAAARAILGPDLIIGGTANTFGQLQQRVAEGADYIGLGPYRFTTTKQNLSPVIGLQGYVKLMEQAKAAGIGTPVIAIGGITADDIPLLMQAGLYGVAVSGALSHPQDTSVVLNHINHLLC